MKKFNRIFKRLLKQFKKLISFDEYEKLLKYLIYLISKNKKILEDRKNKISKITGCKRGEIFLVDFGFGIGTEFRYNHYCVVIAVDRSDVVVIPFTSKKHKTNLIVDLGVIKELQYIGENKNSYALIKSIRSISRNRLVRPNINRKMIYPKLNNEQLTLIDEAIKKYLTY